MGLEEEESLRELDLMCFGVYGASQVALVIKSPAASKDVGSIPGLGKSP